jgi:L-aspartate oxidase
VVLFSRFMKGLPAETDFVVIGASVAGLRAAIDLAAAGRVLVLNKKEIPNFSAVDAKSQASWLSDEDDISLHLQDTLDRGDGLCNVAAVKLLLEEAPERIEELIGWGKSHGTKLVFGPENAHSRGRILHAEGQPAGREIYRILCEKLQSLKHVSFAPSTFVTELLTESGQVTGISVLDDKGMPQDISCSAILLGAGGLGQIYRNTTNPDAATGDGVALAFRAGAELSDLEFVQFHPTTLYMKKVPRIPLPGMILEQGGYLRNFELNRFMGKYHPSGERAPRDLILRAIMHEMEVSRAKDPFVYLDITHLRASVVQKQFHRIYETCMAHNLDITEDVIPVRPAAQFCMGGVRTDLEGKSTVRGLYAAGEVACSGVHGANRLPSNALLECIVFGARAGSAMAAMEKKPPARADVPPKAIYSNGPVDAGVEELVGQIQDLMWKEVGIVRTRMGMQNAVKALEAMLSKVAHPKTRRGHEAANLHATALLVARSALAREESRGAHYRMEYPDHDDRKFLKHSVVRGEKIVFLN